MRAITAFGWLASAALAGCDNASGPPGEVLASSSVEIEGRGQATVPLSIPSGTAVLVTANADAIDIRLSLRDASGVELASVDAPYQRGGLETLLVAAGPERRLSLVVEGIEHRSAAGSVQVVVTALPASHRNTRTAVEAHTLLAVATAAGTMLQQPEALERSVAALDRAASSFIAIRDPRHAGIARLHAAALLYEHSGDWQGVVAGADLAVALLREARDAEFTAHALTLASGARTELANSQRKGATPADARAVFARAYTDLDEAERTFAALAMPAERALVLGYRGVAHHAAGDWDAAARDYEASGALYAAADDAALYGVALQNLALLRHEQGDLRTAATGFDRALALLDREDSPENYAHALHNSALPLRALGRFDEAMRRYYEAGQILAGLGNPGGEARALHGMGTLLLAIGEHERALELLQQAAPLRERAGDTRGQIATLVALGNVQRERGELTAAVATHARAAELAQSPFERARTLLAIADDRIALDRPADARAALVALLALELAPTSQQRARALTELGRVESRLGQRRDADAAFAAALAIHVASGSDVEQASTLSARAAEALRHRDYAPALEDTSTALAILERVGARGVGAEQRPGFHAEHRGTYETRIAALVALAEDAQRRDDPATAQSLLRRAYAASEHSRHRVLLEALQHGGQARDSEVSRERQHAQFELLAGKRARREQLLDQATPDRERIAQLTKEIGLLRAGIDLQRASTRDAGETVSTAALDSGPTLAAPRDGAIAEYFVGRRQAWLFLLQDGEIAVHALADAGQLERLSRELHAAWKQPPGGRAPPRVAERAFIDAVFAPLRALGTVSALWIVPDGPLHLAPLAALAADALPGLRDAEIVVVPSITAVAVAAPSARDRARAPTLALIADPVFESTDARLRIARAGDAPARAPVDPATAYRSAPRLEDLQRLPAARHEAEAVAGFIAPQRRLVLTGTAATRAAVLAADLSRYDILHFATHAWADSEDAALATLVLSLRDAAGRPIDGALRAHEIAAMRLDADLVVLSGCETALGRAIDGEGLVGLTQSFLGAGARTVVSSLWAVPDTATAIMMRDFYRGVLREGRSPAQALRLAQRAVQREPKWADPHYWAAFQLTTVAP